MDYINKLLSHFDIILGIISLFILFLVNKPIGIILLTIALIWSIYNNSYIFKLGKANKLYNLKDYDNALNLYRQLIKRRNIPGSVINNYLILELKYGNPKIADDFAAKIKFGSNFKKPDILSTKVSKCLIAWKNNRKDEALANLKIILNEGKNTYIYETLSTLLISAGKNDEALNVINEGLDYTDTSKVLKSNLGEVNFLLGDKKNAEKIFNSLIEENVAFLEPYYYYGLILKDKGMLTEAISTLNKGLSFNDSLVSLINKKKITEVINSINNKIEKIPE